MTVSSAQVVTLANALPVASGGTGQITANASFNAIAPSQTSNSGKYLTTDGTNTSWGTVSAPSAATPTVAGTVYGNTTPGSGTENCAGGYQALNVATGIKNCAFGTYSGYQISSGTYNTFLGGNSGAAMTTGSNNVGVGFQALASNSATSAMTAVGYQALYANTTGSDNVAVGYKSMFANTTGYENVAIGNETLLNATTGQRNTALGNNCLRSNSTSSDNCAVGWYALRPTTGNRNTAVGSGAGSANTSGISNTYVGYSSGTTITTGTGSTYIGDSADASAAGVGNEIAIGYRCTGQGGATASIGDNVGKVYVNYRSSGTWTQTSDGRLKTNINPDTLGLSFINRLNPVTYKWKPSNEIEQSLPYYAEENNRDIDTVMHGLIAQEVKAALDAEGVSSFDGWKLGVDGVQNISREMFVTPLINAVKELKALNDTLTARITALENR
jgi:hypothetical protein